MKPARLPLALAAYILTGILACAALADDLGFEGHKLVEPDCDAMSDWFECRDIDTAPPGVFLGYLYMHHTSATLGPGGNTKYPDTGEPYVTTDTACSSCHFTGGHVPFGSPVYQSPSKYRPDPETGLGPYFRPLGYHRDLEDSVIDCFRNCMNADRAPAKDDPVMVALVEYIQWVADGVVDPAMREDWTQLPPEAGPNLPTIPGVSSMRAAPDRGAVLYAANCADCHDEDGPGAGEFRIGDIRPRIPALWGIRDGYSRGAAFYRTPVLAAYVQKHMPYDDPETLGDQNALDIAAYINAPDKLRPDGMADDMYWHDDADGIPSALRKPADWLVGFEYPGEREHFKNQGIDYDDMVLNGPWDALTAWRAAEIDRLQQAPDLSVTVSAENTTIPRGSQFQFDVSITSNDDSAHSTRIWATRHLPDGSTQDPWRGPRTKNFNPGQTRSWSLSVNVGPNAPLGAYRLYIRTGEQFPGPIWGEAFIDYTVVE